MALLTVANVALTDTFNTWRIATNQAITDAVSSVDTGNQAIAGGLDVAASNTSFFRGITEFSANTNHSAIFNNTSTINAVKLAATGLVTAPRVEANTAAFTSLSGTLTGSVSGDTGSFDGPVTAPLVTSNTLTSSVNVNVGNSAIFTSYENGAGVHPSHQVGRFFYDGVHEAFNFQTDISGFNGEVGMNEYLRVYNNSGGTLSKGEAAYLSGVHTDNATPTAAKGDASDAAKYNISGLVSEDITNGSFGYITVSGEIRDFDTSGVTAGQRVFVSATTPGALVTTAPTYPNYPMCVGYVVNSDATNGNIVIEQQNHSVPSFRVINNAYIGGDVTIAGDLTVQGTETTIATTGLNVGNTFIYVGAGDDIANAQFTGSGINDLTFKGYYNGTGSKTYYVRIDGTGTPDTFEWSVDNFSTTEATDVAITGSNQTLANGISVLFNATTGHTLNDVWDGTVTHSEVDLGFVGHYNDGSGYTHSGLFRDATDDTWKFFNGYDPEVSGAVNTGDGSFVYGNVRAAGLTGTTGTFAGPITTPLVTSNTASIGVLTITDNIKFNNFMREEATIVADNPAATQTFDVKTSTVQYYTTDADTNFTLNVRGDGSTSLDSIMSNGESLSLTLLVTNGASAYYLSALQIDGSSVTPKYVNGSAPSAGNANSIDVYSLSIIKTASATFTVLASQNQFA